MSTTVAGGTSLTQQRNLVTEIPGPRSQEKLARKRQYVADGVGNTLPVFIMTYAGFFPILLGTVAGVRDVDRRLIDAARTMGVPQRTIVTRVVVPAALPSLMVALRLGVATSWTAVVAAELIGAPSGLGYAVEWYRELLMTPQVMAFIAMIGVLGYVCDRLARMLSRAFAPWASR